ncbi:hypothetical protein NC652_020878 [Populus alba x Populus x berolinensis]|nr:hypothetical protein NC652_020878 [Populus alba x Populus x berolinensis]
MAFNLDRDTSRAECRKDGAGLCRCSLHLLLTCPSVLYLTHELHPVKWRGGDGEKMRSKMAGFIKNLPLLKK